MSVRVTGASSLLDALAKEWLGPTALELIALWGHALDAKVSIRSGREGFTEFSLAPPKLRLRGFHDIPCLILGGPAPPPETYADFVRRTSVPGGVSLMLALSESAAAIARGKTQNATLVLGAQQISDVLSSPSATAALRQLILQSVPRSKLNPYNASLAPEHNMFFGRRAELKKLLDNEQTSYALAGPGRIGKTSLVTQYRRELAAQGTGRAAASFYLDLQECKSYDADSLANFIATHTEGTSRSQKTLAADFFNFLRRMRSHLGHRMELILDEADEACHGEFFEDLAEASKQGLVRLVLCGRGSLLRAVHNVDSHLFGRVDWLRPGPLDDAAAREMVAAPLLDLGFAIPELDRVVSELVSLTGRLPHLLQSCGSRIAEYCIERNQFEVTPAIVQRVRNSFELTQLFLSPLDLLGAEERTVAIELLNTSPEKITYGTIHGIAQRLRIDGDLDRVREITHELFIRNVLAWHEGHYSIAYDALPLYARTSGVLSIKASSKAAT